MSNFTLPKSLRFLKSTRFWAMVFGILATFLAGEITAVEAIQAFFTGFIGIRTVDRISEKVGGNSDIVNVGVSTEKLNT